MALTSDPARQDPVERLTARVSRVGTGTRRHWEAGFDTGVAADGPPAAAEGIASDWITAGRWYAVMHGYVDHLGGVDSRLIAGPGGFPESDWLAILRELPDDPRLDTMNAVVKRNLRGLLDPLVAAMADNRAVDLSLHRLAMPRLREFPADPAERAKFKWLSMDLALRERPKLAMLAGDPYVRARGRLAVAAEGVTVLADRRELLDYAYATTFRDGVEAMLSDYRQRHSDAGITLPWSGLYASALSPLLKPAFEGFVAEARRLAGVPDPAAGEVDALAELGERGDRRMAELTEYFGGRNRRYKSAIRLMRVQALAARRAKTSMPQRACCGFLANGAGAVCVECVKVPEEQCVKVPEELSAGQEEKSGALWRAREAKLERKGLRRAR